MTLSNKSNFLYQSSGRAVLGLPFSIYAYHSLILFVKEVVNPVNFGTLFYKYYANYHDLALKRDLWGF